MIHDSGRLPAISLICQSRSFSSLGDPARQGARHGGTTRWNLAAAAAAFGCVAGLEFWRHHYEPTRSEAAEEKPSPDELKKAQAPGKADGLPLFTRAEVAAHNKAEVGIWVTYKEGVYDITEFVAGHPGGAAKILLAAGRAVDPFWGLYQQHYNSRFPLDTLGPMRIGTLHPSELAAATGEEGDAYAGDPARHPALIVHGAKPCSAETPPELVLDSYLTPNELFFVRHHLPVPDIDPAAYRLAVSGPGIKTTEFTLQDLKTKFPVRTVVATLQCSGNRRSHFSVVRRAQGIMWDTGAISTAQYRGAALRDVLRHCGVDPDDPAAAGVRHVHFQGADEVISSIPAGKAMAAAGDVILAYEMNGGPVPRDHGFPVRGIVPGHAGVRNVKWLTSIVAAPEEAEGMWQRGVAYKLLPPTITDFAGIPPEVIAQATSAQEAPVNSVVVEPRAGASVDASEETIEVKGWAWSGGGRGVIRVEVSADGGATWAPATLGGGAEQPPDRAWAWTLWSAEVPVPPAARAAARAAAAAARGGAGAGTGGASFEVVCRAVDAAGNSQPADAAPIWNLRGLNCNTWHRRPVRIDP